jgi:hypothetical protein
MKQTSLADLEQSHQALEDQIADAMLHKAVDAASREWTSDINLHILNQHHLTHFWRLR